MDKKPLENQHKTRPNPPEEGLVTRTVQGIPITTRQPSINNLYQMTPQHPELLTLMNKLWHGINNLQRQQPADLDELTTLRHELIVNAELRHLTLSVILEDQIDETLEAADYIISKFDVLDD